MELGWGYNKRQTTQDSKGLFQDTRVGLIRRAATADSLQLTEATFVFSGKWNFSAKHCCSGGFFCCCFFTTNI